MTARRARNVLRHCPTKEPTLAPRFQGWSGTIESFEHRQHEGGNRSVMPSEPSVAAQYVLLCSCLYMCCVIPLNGNGLPASGYSFFTTHPPLMIFRSRAGSDKIARSFNGLP